MATPAGPSPQRHTARYVTRVGQLTRLSPAERAALAPVAQRYAFRATRRYLDLIDWDDPHDPIRRLIVPDARELEDWGRLDASNEAAVTVAPGTQHKYPDTALLLCNEVCGGFCRYCFRKRLFMQGNDEVSLDVRPGLAYIAAHTEISDVLLTGGDPLLLSARRLLEIVRAVAAIPHVQVVRIGSKMPAFDPLLLLERRGLIEGLAAVTDGGTRVYLMTHFDHPRELTEDAHALLERMLRAGVACANQCPLIRGINDDADTLAALFQRLCHAGVSPYYLFQGRPTAGNAPFEVPITEGFRAFDAARVRVSGLAGRARMVMSHELGKIEVLGIDDRRMYLRFHRAKHPDDRGRLMLFDRDDDACWLDDLVPVGDVGPRVAARTRRRAST
jgi:lysine 2,3-aminomutase